PPSGRCRSATPWPGMRDNGSSPAVRSRSSPADPLPGEPPGDRVQRPTRLPPPGQPGQGDPRHPLTSGPASEPDLLAGERRPAHSSTCRILESPESGGAPCGGATDGLAPLVRPILQLTNGWLSSVRQAAGSTVDSGPTR